MNNHFRTLLLNLPYQGTPSDHIPKECGHGLQLPLALKNFHDLLFPPQSTREYRQFLAHGYLQLLNATPYVSVLSIFDSRQTYDLQNSRYFKIHRVSNPIVSNPAFPLYIVGQYNGDTKTKRPYDYIRITQNAGTSAVDVTSTVTWVKYLTNQSLSFTNNTSQLVAIPDTGLSFQIVGPNFTSSSNKTWDFYAETPAVFDFNAVYNKVFDNTGITQAMIDYGDSIPTFVELWKQHPNKVYQMAGLLITYVLKLNDLWASQSK